MDWVLFWTAFGAIGGSVGALATAAAVIVALWQVKRAERKKIKISFSDSMQIISQGSSQPEEKVINLSVTNVGNRKIIINQWGFDYHNKNGHALLGFNQSPLMQQINPQLPHQLDVEERADLYLERGFFVKSLKEGVEKGNLDRTKTVTFFVTDSAGQIYRVKSSKTVLKMIKE